MGVYSTGLGQAEVFDKSGKYTGCWTGSEFTQDSTFNFAPMPTSEILKEDPQGRTKVDILTSNLEGQSRVVQDLAKKTKEKYKAFLAKEIEGQGFFETDATFQNRIQEAGKELFEGSALLTQTGEAKRQMYITYLQIMTYAPSTKDWMTLCDKKKAVDAEFEALSSELVELGVKGQKILLEAENKKSGIMAMIERLLRGFLDAVKDLVRSVIQIFGAILKSIGMFARFVAKYPHALWIGGGVVAIGVLGFVLRPYFSIASAAIETATGD